jgi:hypothetical protein
MVESKIIEVAKRFDHINKNNLTFTLQKNDQAHSNYRVDLMFHHSESNHPDSQRHRSSGVVESFRTEVEALQALSEARKILFWFSYVNLNLDL